MSVLIIDDHDSVTWAERVREILTDLNCPHVPIHPATDFFAAEQLLCDPAKDIRVVLLDQWFQNPACRLLGEDLAPAKERYPALEQSQGFWIARRIARDLGRLRPAVFMFTGVGGEVEQAAELCQEGTLDEYQSKPPADKENPATLSLRRFLAWQYAPAKALIETGAVAYADPACVAYLNRRIGDWRSDTRRTLEVLAEIARTETGGELKPTTVDAAIRAGRMPDLKAAWTDNSLWDGLAQWAFGEARPWRFPGDPVAPRLRYYQVRGARPGFQRVVVLLCPRFVPDLLGPRRELLEQWAPVLTRHNQWEPGNHRLFRLPLPPRTPGSQLPYLLGTWFDIASGGDWVPLAALRRESLQEGVPLRGPLGDVFQAIDLGARDDSNRLWNVPPNRDIPGWGLLADGVLINREGHRPRAWNNWHILAFPNRMLGLHPDPEGVGKVPENYDQQTNGLWLQALAGWFAFGRLPARGRVAWQRVRRLVGNEPVPVSIAAWWGDAEPEQSAPVAVRGRRLELSRRHRCLGERGAPPLRVSESLSLTGCELVCDAEGEVVAAAFEQLRFEHLVELRDCKVCLADGRPAPLIFRNCAFAAGLTIDGLNAAELEFRDCVLEGESSLLMIRDLREAPILFLRLSGEGKIHIQHGDVPDIRLEDGTVGEVHFGPALKMDRLRVTRWGGPIRAESVIVREWLRVHLGSGGSWRAQRGRWGEATFVLTHGCGAVELRELNLTQGLLFQADSSSVSLNLEDIQVEHTLELSGQLQLTGRRIRLARDMRCQGQLLSLNLVDVEAGGSFDWKDVRVEGKTVLRECRIGGVFRSEGGHFAAFEMASSVCIGGMFFAGCHVKGPWRLGTEEEEFAGVVVRDQLDLSGAVFGDSADFSRVVVSQECKFQRVAFAGQVRFAGAIVQGVLDMREALFAEPLDLTGATIERAVRLAGARWPRMAKGPVGRFENLVVHGLLDLSDPRDTTGVAHSAFWVDLTEASVDRLQLEEPAMERALEHAEAAVGRAASSEDRQRLARLARFYEAALLHEMRFEAAEYTPGRSRP